MDLRLLSLAMLWSYGLRARTLTFDLGDFDLIPWDSSYTFDLGFPFEDLVELLWFHLIHGLLFAYLACLRLNPNEGIIA
jgi:hypothetical protein